MMRAVREQLIRYVFVGLGLNVAFYAAYLLLTWRMLSSEAAMTIIFSLGVLFSFLAHRNITFRHRGDHFAALRRFLTCYAILYLINFIALWVVAGHLGVPHQIVQGCAIPVVAVLAFIVQKYWVFPAAAGAGKGITTRGT